MTQEKQSDEQYHLISLSPKNDLYDSTDDKTRNEYSYYKSILDNSLTDNNNNVAISGKYGSGKSSLIYSYFNDEDSKIKEESTLKINFSNLNENNDYDSNDDGENNDRPKSSDDNVSSTKLLNEISLSIINQIIYQIDYSRIPLTHFKTKQDRPWSQTILLYITFLLGVISIFVLNNYTFNHWKLYLFVFCFLILFSYFALKFIKNFDLKKVKIGFKNVETDINYENDDFFERYVDEIIYLFTGFEKESNSENYVLIIEDLDRFNDTEIFRKLKNLNIKLNQKSDKHWVFLYLIKDSLFKTSTERTKFFDIIIPVIPFITTYNSYDKLKNEFGGEIPDDLLRYVSNFIYDYRLLLNIRNEYTLFKKLTNSVSSNELFSLIVYKNIFPNEFDEFQNGHGIMEKIIQNYRLNITNLINKKIQKIDEIKINTLVNFAHSNNYVYYPNGSYGIREIDPDDAVNIVKNNLLLRDGNSNQIKYSELESKEDYIQYLNSHNYDLEMKNLSVLKKYNFSSINGNVISEDYLKSDDNDNKAKEFNYLLGLINMGYITIDYLNTINHFYGNTNDKKFIHKLYDNEKNFNVDLHLINFREILHEIEECANKNVNLLQKPQILNTELFAFALDNKKNIAKRMISVAKNIEPGSDGYHFIEHFISGYNKYVDEILSLDDTLLLSVSDMELSDNGLVKIIKNDNYQHDKDSFKFIIDKANRFNNTELLSIINSDKIDDNLKDKLMDNLDSIDFNNVNDYKLWNKLLEKKKISPSFGNIMTYHNEMEESSEDFYKFINKVNIPYKEIEHEPDEKSFISSLIFNSNITLDTAKDIVSYLNVGKVSSEDAIQLNNDKFQLLFDKKLIDLKNNDILDYIANNPIDVSKDDQYVEIVNNLDSRYDNDDKVEVKNEKLLNCAINKYDLKSFKFVSRRLDSIENLNLVDYLKHMKDKLNLYEADLNRLIKVIKRENGWWQCHVNSTEIILHIADFMKSNGYIGGYKPVENNNDKIHFYK